MPDTRSADADGLARVSPTASAGEKSNESVTRSVEYISEKLRVALGIMETHW